jgi:hypothetical protein
MRIYPLSKAFLLSLALLAACSQDVAPDSLNRLNDSPTISVTAAGAAVQLYAQLDNSTNISAAGGDSAEAYAADDFAVPTGENWDVTEVGIVSGSRFVFPTYTVAFFGENTADPTKPGALVAKRTYTAANTFQRGGLTIIPLSTSVALTAGTYWVAVDGRFVNVRTPITGQHAVRGTAGNFARLTTGFTTEPVDLRFALFATESAPADATLPTITLTTPTDEATYLLNQAVSATYSCADEEGGSGVKTCEGTVPSGSPIDTSSVGTKTFSVTATDNAGNTDTETVSYTVTYAFSGFTSRWTTFLPSTRPRQGRPSPLSGALPTPTAHPSPPCRTSRWACQA